MKIILSIYLFVFSFAALAQLDPKLKIKVDSLKNCVKSSKSDTAKLSALLAWDNLIYFSDPLLDEKLNYEIKALCLKNLKKKLTKKETLIFKKGLAFAYNNLGIVFRINGNLSNAIKYYVQALKLNEEIGNVEGVIYALSNIGSIYNDQKEYRKAIDYYERSLKMAEQVNLRNSMPNNLNNIGTCYGHMNNYPKAFKYFKMAMAVSKEVNSIRDLVVTNANFGTVYLQQNLFDSSIFYHTSSLELAKQIDDKEGQATAYVNLGNNYLNVNDFKKAIFFCEKSMEIALEIHSAYQIEKASQNLSSLYEKAGRFKDALAMKELFIKTRDSIINENSKKELVRQEFKYAYEKKAAIDSARRSEEKRLSATTLKNEQFKKYLLYCLLLLTFVFGIFMFSRLRITRKQKKIIEDQKKLVEHQKLEMEEKQREIIDSIHYAKRIQIALLTSEKYFDKVLKRLNRNK